MVHTSLCALRMCSSKKANLSTSSSQREYLTVKVSKTHSKSSTLPSALGSFSSQSSFIDGNTEARPSAPSGSGQPTGRRPRSRPSTEPVPAAGGVAVPSFASICSRLPRNLLSSPLPTRRRPDREAPQALLEAAVLVAVVVVLVVVAARGGYVRRPGSLIGPGCGGGGWGGGGCGGGRLRRRRSRLVAPVAGRPAAGWLLRRGRWVGCGAGSCNGKSGCVGASPWPAGGTVRVRSPLTPSVCASASRALDASPSGSAAAGSSFSRSSLTARTAVQSSSSAWILSSSRRLMMSRCRWHVSRPRSASRCSGSSSRTAR